MKVVTSASSLLREAAAIVVPLARRLDVRIAIGIPHPDHLIREDGSKAVLALVLLLSDVLRLSRAGALVRMHAWSEAGMLHVDVLQDWDDATFTLLLPLASPVAHQQGQRVSVYSSPASRNAGRN